MKDLVIAVRNTKTRNFVGAITKVEFKNVDGKCNSFITWSGNPRKALRLTYQINATQICVWICSGENHIFGEQDQELVITTYDHLIETYESSKKLEQIRQKAIKRAEKGDISSKTLKEIYGNDLIDKLEKGQQDGIYVVYTDLLKNKKRVVKATIDHIKFIGGYLRLEIRDIEYASITAISYGKTWALTRQELEKVVR